LLQHQRIRLDWQQKQVSKYWTIAWNFPTVTKDGGGRRGAELLLIIAMCTQICVRGN